MDSEERNVWRQLVRQANRYGHEGKRVIAADVIFRSQLGGSYVDSRM